MNKEEILKMSRDQKEDEGTVYAENRGRRFGVAGFCAVFIIIMVFNIFTKQKNFIPYSMFFAYLAAEAYGRYGITNKKALLATTILGTIASVLFLICHILTVMEIGI